LYWLVHTVALFFTSENKYALSYGRGLVAASSLVVKSGPVTKRSLVRIPGLARWKNLGVDLRHLWFKGVGLNAKTHFCWMHSAVQLTRYALSLVPPYFSLFSSIWCLVNTILIDDRLICVSLVSDVVSGLSMEL
jgi:hypothetical protein